MWIRACASAALLLALAPLALGSEPQFTVDWPSSGTPAIRFTFSKFREISTVQAQRLYVTDTTAQNLSGNLIQSQHLSLYVFDKKQVRIGDAWMQVDNLGPNETVKFQVTVTASGVPATLSVFAASEIPKTVSLTVNSVPQGALLKVDGVAAGVTPRVVKVGVGKHQLEFSKDGYSQGTFPLEIGPDDVSGGTVSYELGSPRFDTIQLRDGSVLSGDLDSVSGMDVVIRIGGNLQHFNRNQVKQIILVERDPPSQDSLPPASPK